MRLNEMNALIKHFDRYFAQTAPKVIHPLEDDGAHVDVLIYEPNESYPFWKLVTMGASDYKMPKHRNTTEVH